MDPNHHNPDENSRGLFNFPSQQRTSEPHRPSPGPSLSQSQSHQAWPQFSISTTTDSLSSSFKYDPRLRQLGVSTEEWRQFTSEVVNEAKLSLEDDKVAWGAGIATGTAGSALLLLLGPVAGYYTGKAVHKRTVVEKVKERLLEDGQMSRVLRKWNGGVWAQKGFHAWIELPDQACGVKGGDGKRFRILVIPGVGKRPESPIRPESSAGGSESQRPPSPMHPSSSAGGSESQQTAVGPKKRPVPPLPSFQDNVGQVEKPTPQPQSQPTQIPAEQKLNYLPPPPIQHPVSQTEKPIQQPHNQPTHISAETKFDYPPPPILPPVSQTNIPVQQTTQNQPTHIPIPPKFDPPPAPPTAPSSHQPPPVPHRDTTVEPSYQQPSVPHRDSDTPLPLFYHAYHPDQKQTPVSHPDQKQTQVYHAYHPDQKQTPAAENYPPPPPLPAKDPPVNNYSSNHVYEMPSNEPSHVFELPDNRAGIAELPSESVQYYEMDGGSVPQVRR